MHTIPLCRLKSEKKLNWKRVGMWGSGVARFHCHVDFSPVILEQIKCTKGYNNYRCPHFPSSPYNLLITSPSLRQKPFIIIMIILMMIMLIMTWMKIIMLCWMMIWVLRSVRCLSYSYHVSTELGMKMAPCKAMLLGCCALNVFEGTRCACLSPLIAFNVSKEISLVNLVHALRCSDRSYANNKASSLIHLCWFVMGWRRHID